jgi:hypothetical protein
MRRLYTKFPDLLDLGAEARGTDVLLGATLRDATGID